VLSELCEGKPAPEPADGPGGLSEGLFSIVEGLSTEARQDMAKHKCADRTSEIRTCPVSTGGRDETCPLSTGGRGGGARVRRPHRAAALAAARLAAGCGLRFSAPASPPAHPRRPPQVPAVGVREALDRPVAAPQGRGGRRVVVGGGGGAGGGGTLGPADARGDARPVRRMTALRCNQQAGRSTACACVDSERENAESHT